MIEVFLAGDYLGTPHDIGAWAYLLRRGEDLVGEGKGSDRPKIVTSRLASEAAGLALALEDLIRGWSGEDVAVRTSSAGLEGLLLRHGKGLSRDLERWYARMREAARRCSSVRFIPVSPADLTHLRAAVWELLPAPRRPLIARASELLPGQDGPP